MRVIPNMQVTATLAYLKTAMRGDEILVGKFGAIPDEVVAGTMESAPVVVENEQLKLARTMEPCLALHELESVVHFVGPVQGFKCQLQLWYVFSPPLGDMDGDLPVTSDAKSERWKTAIWTRLVHHIRVHETKLGDPATPWDLLTEGQIYSLEAGKCQFFPTGRVCGLKATLEMVKVHPPWAKPSPRLLNMIELTLPVGDVDTPTGPTVVAEIDTSA